MTIFEGGRIHTQNTFMELAVRFSVCDMYKYGKGNGRGIGGW